MQFIICSDWTCLDLDIMCNCSFSYLTEARQQGVEMNSRNAEFIQCLGWTSMDAIKTSVKYNTIQYSWHAIKSVLRWRSCQRGAGSAVEIFEPAATADDGVALNDEFFLQDCAWYMPPTNKKGQRLTIYCIPVQLYELQSSCLASNWTLYASQR